MARKYQKLRTALFEAEIDQATVAYKLKRSSRYVSERMTGKYPWTVEDAYLILEMLEEPKERLTELFPPAGEHEKRLKAV